MAGPRQIRAVHSILIMSLLIAATVDAVAERLPTKTYTTADGLPRDHVRRIFSDSHGYLWFCTPGGLSRFDGYGFNNYGVEDGLPYASLNCITQGPDGSFWVGTNGSGLCRFNPDPDRATTHGLARARPVGAGRSLFTPYPLNGEVEKGVIFDLYTDHSGFVWVSSSAGLFFLPGNSQTAEFVRFDLSFPGRSESVDKAAIFAEDKEGGLWIGTRDGLVRRMGDGRVFYYSLEKRFGTNHVLTIAADRTGRLWLGLPTGLVVVKPEPASSFAPVSELVRRVIHPQSTAKTSPSAMLPDSPGDACWLTSADGLVADRVTILLVSEEGRVWAGSHAGLSEFDGRRFRDLTLAQGLINNRIHSLSEDRGGNLWVGTELGAVRVAKRGFTSFGLADGLSDLWVIQSGVTRAGDVYFVTNRGFISTFNGNGFLSARPNIPEVAVRDVPLRNALQDQMGEWWLATELGLYRFPKLDRPEQLSRSRPKAVYTTASGLATNLIYRLFEDSRGDIWIATLGGSGSNLARWERATETLNNYSVDQGLPPGIEIWSFAEDRAGAVWLSSRGGDLIRHRAAGFTVFRETDGVPRGAVRGLYIDQAGRLWIATSRGGLGRVDDPTAERPKFRRYATTEGLADNETWWITGDQWGRIYVGLGRGLDRLDPETDQIRHYSPVDGLAASVVWNSIAGRDGTLWFGTPSGVSRVAPNADPLSSPPPIVIRELRVAGAPYELSESGETAIRLGELSAGENQIEIDFLGLAYGFGETLGYQYKLEGGGSDWSEPTRNRSINFANLRSGTYRFLVRAITADGTMSSTPASVDFRILPPIWQRWWFVALVMVLISIPIAAVARYRYQRITAERRSEEALRRSREERLIELEQVRRRIAVDLHDDIGSSLSQIYLLSEVVRQRIDSSDSGIVEPLTMISNASHEVVSSMSDIVWAINPQKDHLSDLTLRMRRFASDAFGARDISFRFNAPDAEDIRLGANIRREVFLIFKESVNNLIKHSACAEAEIEFKVIDNTLVLKVSDNGKGFDPNLVYDGHGLVSMRERAASIDCRLEVSSKEGVGSIVTLRIPFAPQATAELSTASGADAR